MCPGIGSVAQSMPGRVLSPVMGVLQVTMSTQYVVDAALYRTENKFSNRIEIESQYISQSSFGAWGISVSVKGFWSAGLFRGRLYVKMGTVCLIEGHCGRVMFVQEAQFVTFF